MNGMLHIYTGNGKGKTTASLGLALRSLGAGKKVLLLQFLKSGKTSETKALGKFKNFSAKSFGRDVCITKKNVTKRDYELAEKGLAEAKKAVSSKKFDLIVLDEINVAVKFGLLKLNDVLQLVKSKPANLELVLTGRFAHKKLLKEADLVTEMKEIKHYFRKGIRARKGIEF